MRSKFKWIFTLLVALTMQFSFAQEKTVTGVVSDEIGPIAGANVIVKGTSRGTTTDFDGNYAISAKVGEVLEFSYVGYGNQDVTVGVSDSYNVILKATQLEEVVVLGYGVERGKNEITGNVVKLSEDVIQKSSFVSVDQAMQGKVAGLTISTSSGTPGSVQDVRIRGIQSINASNSPLYVIDGVPVVSGDLDGSGGVYSSLTAISTLNSADIESITVLKDAAATSVYGARGTNGVIIVTTKKGKKGEAKFNVRTGVGFINNASRGLKPLNGAQKQEMFEEAMYNSFGATFIDPFYGGDTYAFIDDNGIAPDLIDWNNNGRLNHDWEKEVTNKDALMKDYAISVTSGSEKSKFYASLGLNNTEGTVIASDYKRISGIVNYQTDLTDKLRLTTSVNGSNVIQNGVMEGAAYFSNPNLSKYFLSPWINPYNADGSYNISDINNFTSLHNTLYTARKNIRRNEVLRGLINTKIEYEIIKNLKFTSVIGLDYILTSYKGYNSPDHGDGEGVGGYTDESTQRNFNLVAQNSLDYSFTLAEDHNFSAKALIEYQKNKNNYLYAYGENFPNNIFTSLDNTSANWFGSGNFQDWISKSYLGLLNYNYQGKYLLDLSYRYEGNSRFIEEERFGSFYSVGLAWNLHKENFIADNLGFFSTLRIRGSHGLSGNAGIGINEYQALLNFDGTYNQNPGSYPSTFGNNVGWENAVKNDFGLDFGLFNERISGSFAYFSNRTYDMLLDVPLPLSSGFNSTRSNVGEMTNKGFEIELSFDVLKRDDMSWNISGNFTSLKNEVTKMSELVPSITTGTRRIEVGHQVYEWYMPTWAGVDPANGDPLWYVNGVDGATTNIYADAQRVYQGESALPTYSGGISTNFTFKGFFVDASIYFAGGHKVYEDWASYTQTSRASRFGPFNATTVVYDGRWQQPGDNATHPRLEWNNTIINNAANTSSRFLYDGDYVRLRDVSLGYNFPSKFLKGTGLDGVQVVVRGNNLLTKVKDDRLKYDPEVRADGFTRLTTPPTKSVMFQLNLNF